MAKNQLINLIQNLNDNVLTVEVSYGTKTSLDQDDTSRKYFEVVVGTENIPDVPQNQKLEKGDLVKFNSRYIAEGTWIDGKFYCVTDRRNMWYKIPVKDVKADLIKRSREQ